MSSDSRRLAGLLLVILPTVMVGGVSILTLLIHDPAYMRNPLRQDLWRAGHAHAGVLLLLSVRADSCGRTRTLPEPGARSRMVVIASPAASSG